MSRTASKPPRLWGRLGRRLLQPAFWRHGRSEIVWDPVRIIEAARSVAFPVYGLAADWCDIGFLADARRESIAVSGQHVTTLVTLVYGHPSGDSDKAAAVTSAIRHPVSNHATYFERVWISDEQARTLAVGADDLHPPEPAPTLKRIAVDGQSVPFKFYVLSGDHWAAEAPLSDVTITVEGWRWSVNDLALTRIANLDPYIEEMGRQLPGRS
jgi:hypothetical protein